MNKFKTTLNSREAGVSLMLAILVLAAITAVAFSLAGIVFIEIKNSGDALRTEPALYATFGVTEEALYQYKRFYTGPDLNVPSCLSVANSVCNINNVTLTLPGTQPIIFDNSPRLEFIAKRSTTTLPMYIPSSYAKQYTSVTVELLPNETSQSLNVHLNAVDNEGNVRTDGVGTVIVGQPFTFTDFTNNEQFELVLDNSRSTQDLNASITTTRVPGGQGTKPPQGLPFVGESVLRIKADYQGLTRTYQVRIPIP